MERLSLLDAGHCNIMHDISRVIHSLSFENTKKSPPPPPRLGYYFARMCVSKSEEHGLFFLLQRSEMSENISLKMGVKFAASLNMAKN